MANIKVKRSAVPGKIPLTTDLQLGEFAVNTHDGKVYIKKNVSGVETVEAINAPALQNLQNRYSYAISGSSQSTFSAQYVVPYVDVYLNGVHLASSDYIATNGTSVVLNTAAQVGDVVEIVALNSYTANSDFLNVPGGIATADFLKFDTTATNTPEVAKLNWNADDGTLEFGLKGGQVVLQVGQEQVQRIYNNTGSTLVSGQIVYVTGSQGNRLTVALASASSEATSTRTFGIVTETILNEAEGFIATSGLVRGLDTSSFAEGSVLWLGTSAGTYTTTRPAAPNHGVLVGFVVRQHASVGSVFVHIANGYELDELHDVLIASKQDGQALVYEASSGLWKNKFVDYNTLLNKPTLVTQTDINNAIASLVDTAPATLDTLNELAAALGDDPNFATTVTNLVATKLSLSGGTMTGDITFSGTQTWPTFNQNTTGNAATSTTATNVSGGSASVTTLTTSSTVTLNGGTANGVAYLNASKVLTTGSALTFDGTNLGVGTASPGTFVDVRGANGLAVRFIETSTGNTNRIQFGTGSGFGYIDATAGIGSTALAFQVGSVEQMRLTSTGLLIGRSSTSATGIKLHMSAGALVQFGSGGTTGSPATENGYLYGDNGTSTYSSGIKFHNSFATNGASWLSFWTARSDGLSSQVATLDASGNLGLGVTPSAWTGLGVAFETTGGALLGQGTNNISLYQNAYYSTGFKYKTTNPASSYEQTAGAHRWFTAPSGTAGNAISFTQAMTLDASGNLGIGSTSPSAKLELAGVNNPQIALNGSGATGYRGISYQYSGTQYGFAGLNVQTGEFLIRSGESGQSGYYLTFQTNGSERARITSGGNLLVGTTASQGKLTVQTDITAINSGAWYTAGSNGGVLNLGNEIGNPARVRAVTPASRGAASELALAFDVVSSGGSTFEAARINSNGEFYIAGTTDQGAYNLQVNGTGVWGAGAYVNGSDVRLKENVQTLTDGLSVVTKLRPVTFQYKAEYSKDTAVQPGFIAQELQQAMAGKDYVDGVVQSGPEYLNVAYQSLIPVLVKAIQELKAELDSVKTELATLKGN